MTTQRVAAAGVLLARLDQIAQCKLDHGLASSIRFRRPAPGLRPGNGASLYDYNTSLSPLHEKERSAFYFCAAPYAYRAQNAYIFAQRLSISPRSGMHIRHCAGMPASP